MNENQKSLRTIFNEAAEIADAAERAAYLQQACAGNESLRRKLDGLLCAHQDAGSFLEPDIATAIGSPMTEGSGTTIGRYKLLQQIGEGGFGVVYMAEQKEPVKRRVALKIIKLGMDTKQVVARFEAERQALAMMDHPNIAKVLDGGATDGGRPYFVMELVKGVPITKFCDENSLSTKERLELFITVCHAIQHAHQKGIIHRDVKPSNILVTLHDGKPVPKVIDFGIAKATQQELTEKTIFTQFQQMIGTPAYMSPEQAEMSGLDIDTRTDIYSLGVLLYELLTGKTPLDAKILLSGGYDEIRRRIKEEEPPRPSTRVSTMGGEELTTNAKHRSLDPRRFAAELRGDLDWIAMKALEKDRTRRYETATGFAQDIQRFLGNEPVVARPPTATYRFRKMVRRNKLAFAAAALVFGAVGAAGVVSTWQAMRATRAQKAAETARASEKQQLRIAQQKQTEAESQKERAEAGESRMVRQLYIDKMNLAQAAWNENHGSRVRELLNETATAPGRGFEWSYWQRQMHLNLKTLRGHFSAVLAVAYSPDGLRIVTGSADLTAKVWEAATGKELLTLRGHGDAIRSVAFSPDGQQILTGSWDSTATVWDVASGKEVRTLRGHTSGIFSAVFSPDGRRIVTGSRDKTAKVWDTATGAVIRDFKGAHTGVIWSVAFSPDGERMVTGSWDRTARVWSVATGSELARFEGHQDPILSVAFSPDGKRVVSGSYDQTAKVWDASDGHELFTLSGHTAPIFSVAFSSDGQQIATAGDDQTARVWDAAREELLAVKRHGSSISSVAFSPDRECIITGGGSVIFSPDGAEQIHPRGGDHLAKVWRVSNDKELLTLKGHVDQVHSVAFSEDGQRIVTGSLDQSTKVWDAASGRVLRTLSGHSHATHRVAFSPNGQRIVSGGWDGEATVWDTASGESLLTLVHNEKVIIMSVAFSPDGKRIATVGQDPFIKVWDAATGEPLLTFKGESGWIWSVAFSADGRQILTANEDPGNTAKLWDASSGKERVSFKGHTSWVLSAAFSPDGRHIVTGSDDQTARVWDSATGKNLLTLTGHSDVIMSVSFSPDAQRIVTCSRDQTVKLWDATSGKELLTLNPRRGWIFSVAFSPDGQRVAAANWDGTATVWEAASREQVASWQKEEQLPSDYEALKRREQSVSEAAAAQRAVALRAQLPGGIRKWLVLLPIAAEGKDGAGTLQQQQVVNENLLHPRAGERTKAGQTELAWRAVESENYLIDFNKLAGTPTEWSVGYAVCYIQSDAAQSGVSLKIASDDEARVYLNGNLIYTFPNSRSYTDEEDTVEGLELKAGTNVLVLKVVNERLDWKGSIRLIDATGQPVKRIQVTLAP